MCIKYIHVQCFLLNPGEEKGGATWLSFLQSAAFPTGNVLSYDSSLILHIMVLSMGCVLQCSWVWIQTTRLHSHKVWCCVECRQGCAAGGLTSLNYHYRTSFLTLSSVVRSVRAETHNWQPRRDTDQKVQALEKPAVINVAGCSSDHYRWTIDHTSVLVKGPILGKIHFTSVF